MDPKLATTHPKLVQLWQAIATTSAELGFEPALLEATRTAQRQAELVKAGASRTLNSKHLIQVDGFSRAIDIGADVQIGPGREIRWDWPLYYKLAEVVRRVAREQQINVVWGGCWDRVLNETRAGIAVEVEAYSARHRAQWMLRNSGRYPGPFLDGPHYELHDSVQ